MSDTVMHHDESEQDNHPLLSTEVIHGVSARPGRVPTHDHDPGPNERQESRSAARQVDIRLASGIVCLLGAVLAFLLGWYGISGTADVYAQLPYFLSGGAVGIALLIGAVLLWVDYEHSADRQGIDRVLRRLEALESELSHQRTLVEGLYEWEESEE